MTKRGTRTWSAQFRGYNINEEKLSETAFLWFSEDIFQVSPCVDDTLDNYGSGFSVDTVKHQIIFDSKLMVFAPFVYEYRTDMRKIGKLTD